MSGDSRLERWNKVWNAIFLQPNKPSATSATSVTQIRRIAPINQNLRLNDFRGDALDYLEEHLVGWFAASDILGIYQNISE